MPHWYLGSTPDDDGKRELIMDVNTNDAVGTLEGTLTFQDVEYSVTGHWAASGSSPGRNYSCLAMCGPSGATAPEMVSLCGIMTGPGYSPEYIEANLTRTDSTDGLQYGYGATLKPMS